MIDSLSLRNLAPLLVLVLLFGCAPSEAPNDAAVSDDQTREDVGDEVTDEPRAVMQTESFDFDVAGNTLAGLFDRPVDREASATIIIVHGYGETNVVEGNWYNQLRSTFARIGINTLIWDKPGCGPSGGEFNINQPVQSSAEEVNAAVQALRDRNLPGTETIGLWGVSRAGWIVPLALAEDPSIAFWISVSGTDGKENARYLLEENFRIEGRSEEETAVLIAEWQARVDTVWKNGTYQDYLDAAPNLSADPFMEFMGWSGNASEQAFLADQEKFRTGELLIDAETGLPVYIPDFPGLLASIDLPVLAIFGEQDTNVDWRSTADLYQTTLGANPDAALSIKTFPNANHNLKPCQQCGVREMAAQSGNIPYADGYYESMIEWLIAQGFGSNPST
ncbi:MAG: alpha/beta hydrolase [Acidobacteriota bacterium]